MSVPGWLRSMLRWLSRQAEQGVGAHEAEDVVVTKTTRYLRLAMIGLVIGLATSVLYEHSQSIQRDGTGIGHCWQRSISAYYYTPTQSFFVGALVAIGVSLIALKGSTELEDVLLNFAGFFAPIVAFVPTPNAGTCRSVSLIPANRNENIANNVRALLVCGGLALALPIVLRILHLFQHHPEETPSSGDQTWAGPIALGGYVAAWLLYIAALVTFFVSNRWFIDHAHSLAAITMFVFIFLAVVDNAINFRFTRQRMVADAGKTAEAGSTSVKPPSRINRYLIVAVLMVVAALFIGATHVCGDYKTIWLEASMIALFAVFWVIQTHELWRFGLRTPGPVTPQGTGAPPQYQAA